MMLTESENESGLSMQQRLVGAAGRCNVVEFAIALLCEKQLTSAARCRPSTSSATRSLIRESYHGSTIRVEVNVPEQPYESGQAIMCAIRLQV